MTKNKTAYTLRMGNEERNALKVLSKIEGRPVNQLIVEAVKSYLGQRGEKERNLEASLASLKAYRKKDPGFRRAIAAFVDAEATLKDPIEGEPFEEPEEEPVRPAGRAQSKVREVIGA